MSSQTTLNSNLKFIDRLKKCNDDFESLNFSDNELQRISHYLSKIAKKYADALLEAKVSKEYNDKEEDQRNRTFNGLTAREWTALSRNVWADLSSTRKKSHLAHGATYPKALTDRLITMYSKAGDLIFDPFLGTGTTLLSAKDLDRKGLGIELNKDFADFAREQLDGDSLFANTDQIKLIEDDCRNLEKYLENDSVQLSITSPPYADFIQKSLLDRKKTHKKSKIKLENNSTVKQYSLSENDFGNLPYADFLDQIESILEKIYLKTKPGGYSAWVVKDYRDTQNKIPYVDFHSDLSRVGEKVGFKYHDLVVWDQNEQRSLVLLGYPSVFYTNQNCSFIVIFRKA